MAEPFDSPVDVTASERGLSGLALMGLAVSIAALLLLLFNAHALAAWADGLAPGARSARIGSLAHGVADATAGLDGPRAGLHQHWLKLKAARWPGQTDEDQR